MVASSLLSSGFASYCGGRCKRCGKIRDTPVGHVCSVRRPLIAHLNFCFSLLPPSSPSLCSPAWVDYQAILFQWNVIYHSPVSLSFPDEFRIDRPEFDRCLKENTAAPTTGKPLTPHPNPAPHIPQVRKPWLRLWLTGFLVSISHHDLACQRPSEKPLQAFYE